MSDVTASPSPAEEPTIGQRLRRRLSPPNPFYLLSAAFILHSTGLGLHGQGGLPPLILMGLVGGYVLLMAAIAFCIVRLWNVWDDARSILLVVMLLFVELALSADRPLMESRSTGLIMLFGGLSIAILVTEIILRGLRMRLPALYRGPLYLLWGLLFLYPLALMGPIDARNFAQLPWLLLLFPILAGIGLLTLLPAVRRGRSAFVENGTPWKWPLYPWTIFVFLGLCLLFRSYALCLSFDPALALSFEEAWGLQSIYGPYFAVPLLMAVAVLVMESGIARRSGFTQFVSLWLAAACVVLALPGSGGNAAYESFVTELVARVGSPAWVTLLMTIAFYVVSGLRGSRLAWRGALFGLIGLSVITPSTLDGWTMGPVTSWPLFAAATIMAMIGLVRGRSFKLAEGVIYATLGALSAGWLENDVFTLRLTIVSGLAVAGLLIGAFMRDEDAGELRLMSSILLMLAAADMCFHSTSLHPISWVPTVFLGICCLLPLVIGWWREDRFVRATAAVNGVQWYVGGLLQLFVILIETYRWSGWTSFAAGVAMLHLGVIVSGVKGGAHQRLLTRLFGPPLEPTSS